VALDTYLNKSGLSVKDVDIQTMPFPDMRSALANGYIDAAVPIEPFVAQIVENGIGVILQRDDEIVPRHQVAVILYGPKFVEQKPDVARRFMVAYLKAARLYNDAFEKKDPAKRRDVIDILVKNTAAKDVALYDKMVMPGIDPNGKVNVDSIAEEQDWFLKKGSQKSKLDLSKVVDMQYAEAAVRKLGPYK
jgi:NitT/TauT family transport system substrate-binding protein